MIALDAALFALGHVIRDGWPDLKTLTKGRLGTHAARGFGALSCGLGSIAAYDDALLIAGLWLAVWAGFYIDQHHAAGQGAQTIWDALNLMISGSTSVILAALMLSYSGHLLAADLAFAAGCVGKPAIWFFCRRFIGEPHFWTRWAAGAFGAAFGAAISV